MPGLQDAFTQTPTPSEAWLALSAQERLDQIRMATRNMRPELSDAVEILKTYDDGQVIVRLLVPLSPGDRGTLLLDLEEGLKQEIDEALCVWLEPLGDKSSLRKLRGLQIK